MINQTTIQQHDNVNISEQLQQLQFQQFQQQQQQQQQHPSSSLSTPHNCRKGRTFITTLDANGQPLRFHRGVFDQTTVDNNNNSTNTGAYPCCVTRVGYVIWQGVANGSRENIINKEDHHHFPRAVMIDGQWWLQCALRGRGSGSGDTQHIVCPFHSCAPPSRSKGALSVAVSKTKKTKQPKHQPPPPHPLPVAPLCSVFSTDAVLLPKVPHVRIPQICGNSFALNLPNKFVIASQTEPLCNTPRSCPATPPGSGINSITSSPNVAAFGATKPLFVSRQHFDQQQQKTTNRRKRNYGFLLQVVEEELLTKD